MPDVLLQTAPVVFCWGINMHTTPFMPRCNSSQAANMFGFFSYDVCAWETRRLRHGFIRTAMLSTGRCLPMTFYLRISVSCSNDIQRVTGVLFSSQYNQEFIKKSQTVKYWGCAFKPLRLEEDPPLDEMKQITDYTQHPAPRVWNVNIYCLPILYIFFNDVTLLRAIASPSLVS